ncbi:hypothetical protein [Saccharopolyspora sp. NPDC002376]
MNPPATATKNTAEPGATVGIQAEEVHNSTVYQVLPDDPPSRKYEIGVQFLDDGVPSRARDLIDDAIAQGHDTAEVRFHWVLAMLSKRAYRDLTPPERDQLGRTTDLLSIYEDDEWKRALSAICDLLDCLKDSHSDPSDAVNKLLALRDSQRDKVVRHLDLVLTGGIKDAVWAEARHAATEARFDRNRLDRVWAYFHPRPIGARALRPAAVFTTDTDYIRAVIWSLLFGVAFGYLGWLVLQQAATLPVLAYLFAIAAGYVGCRNALDWHYRNARLRAKDRVYLPTMWIDRSSGDGFASQVSQFFRYYFGKYVPKGTSREQWLNETHGIQTALRNEVVELYRENRTEIDRVNWLIRHLVSDVRRRWESGTLWSYRERYRTPSSMKVWCVLSFVAAAAAVVSAIDAALQTDVFLTAFAVCVALVSGRAATMRWLHIISERRRYAEDYQEYEEALEARIAACQRWKDKLDSTRPEEHEMEAWLDYDKTMVLDEALRHYHLAWRDIIAYAFLQTPAAKYKRARVPGGPWRYSKYDIRLFLITQDGVREVSTELDFEHANFNGQQRNNYRFDAVSSVHVARAGQLSHTLQLTLTNGPTRDIRVMDPAKQRDDASESPGAFSKLNLDAAGFTHALHILEGIAAEGKGWIDRDPHAKRNAGDLPSAADGIGPAEGGAA